MPTQSLRLDETDAWQGCSLAYGHFNTIHPGHIRYLRHARGLGEQLVVALIGDGKTSYAFKQEERAEALSLLGIADAVLFQLVIPLAILWRGSSADMLARCSHHRVPGSVTIWFKAGCATA